MGSKLRNAARLIFRLRIVSMIVAILMSSGCGESAADDPTAPGGEIPLSETVSMPGNSFSPFSVTIRVTGTVKWDFASDEHDVTFAARTGAPASIPVTKRAIISRTFGTIGVFPYDCKIHPGMSGQVTVVQ